MARFIIILNRIVNLYLYFIVSACLLGCVPNINPDYPLFNFIFTAAGFYLIPPIFGVSFSPAICMIVLALVSAGLNKIYNKYCKKEEGEVYILSAETIRKELEILEKRNKLKEEAEEKAEEKDRKDESDV